MLHDTLWNENAKSVRRCLEHPFVNGLADGKLERNAFRRYAAQDAFFLRAFFQVYGLARPGFRRDSERRRLTAEDNFILTIAA